MSEVKPFSPQDAAANQITEIPDEVIEAVNTLLASRYRNGGIGILLKEIVELACKNFERNGKPVPSTREMFAKKWFDVEPAFRKAGWKVSFDKPGYNETYESNFTFTPGDK